MKSGNYDDLMDKFYAGTATHNEINWLTSQGLINQQDRLYAEALKAEREPKTDWDFEVFLNKTPVANVVTLPARKTWTKRIIIAAATIAAILTGYIFWTTQAETKEIASARRIQKPAVATLPPGDEIRKSVIVSAKEKPEFMPSGDSVPKRPKKKQGREKAKKMQAKANMEEFQVMVNGRSITNEEDALDITRGSLAIVSKNLTRINELNPLDRIKSN